MKPIILIFISLINLGSNVGAQIVFKTTEFGKLLCEFTLGKVVLPNNDVMELSGICYSDPHKNQIGIVPGMYIPFLDARAVKHSDGNCHVHTPLGEKILLFKNGTKYIADNWDITMDEENLFVSNDQYWYRYANGKISQMKTENGGFKWIYDVEKNLQSVQKMDGVSVASIRQNTKNQHEITLKNEERIVIDSDFFTYKDSMFPLIQKVVINNREFAINNKIQDDTVVGKSSFGSYTYSLGNGLLSYLNGEGVAVTHLDATRPRITIGDKIVYDYEKIIDKYKTVVSAADGNEILQTYIITPKGLKLKSLDSFVRGKTAGRIYTAFYDSEGYVIRDIYKGASRLFRENKSIITTNN